MVYDVKEAPESPGQWDRIPLYPGLQLSYWELDAPAPACGGAERTVRISYCRSGQIAWETDRGNSIYLNPGDFLLHDSAACRGASLRFPAGRCRGLTVSIDPEEASLHPPQPIEGAGVLEALLEKNLFRSGAAAFFAGNEQTESIFSALYGQPAGLRLPYQRIKVLELLLYLSKVELAPQNRLAEYQAEQLEVVREIHDQLLQHMERRITIDELSRQYLINPTTLKAAFKAVYGTSLAAHIKEHRMEQAAKLLRESDLSIAAVAQAVGYDSQSKFTAAFKEHFALLPSAYRKQYQKYPRG